MDMMWSLLAIGFAAGIAGGLFGIGGGAIMVPAMVLLLGMSQKLSTGTSLIAQIFPIGVLAAIVYYREGNVNIKQGVILAAGLIIGNLLGALFANQPYISDQFMKKLYGVFLFVIGARYLFWDVIAGMFQKQ
ncbi:MAG: sulfite exporter TauE/SafE family protein [Candidatus Hydrogenedentes bacterium]|nr:sulfite exporter TauE/SafE family protein [Candidatus Hydrogenedentota bacterium]